MVGDLRIQILTALEYLTAPSFYKVEAYAQIRACNAFRDNIIFILYGDSG